MRASTSSSRRPSWSAPLTGLALALTSAACEITDITITEPEPLVVVEAYARIRPEGGGTLFALVHGSVGVPGADPRGPEATIRVVADNGTELVLAESAEGVCTYGPGPGEDPRRCYSAVLDEGFVQPGDHITLRVDVVGGGRIEGGTHVPGAYGWTDPQGGSCSVVSGPFLLEWTPSEDTWAYIASIMLSGIGPDLVALGVQSPADSVAFQGVTVSRSDTAIAFPGDFVVDDDVDYELPLTTLVEEGLRPGWKANAYVVAIDRNFTNWVRDPLFNSSGTVRLPSLRGEGTGVFGSSVVLERTLAGSLQGCPGEAFQRGTPAMARVTPTEPAGESAKWPTRSTAGSRGPRGTFPEGKGR